ncbi:MAG: TRAP transporter substrate-binding protein [Alphaproteobacteria bacterium]|nr:TRAP transporter substrate-binding protein [Alphaproteobacteria bacterium]
MRASALAVSLALALALGGAARAETWKMATKQPADGPEGKVFQYFADQAGKYSGGKLTVQVFPNEQLGKEAAVLEQLKVGTVHIYAEGSVFLQKWVPDIRWSNAPFLFDDRDHWVRFINHPMVQGWFNKAKTDAGIGILGDLTSVLRGPYRVMLTKNPVAKVEDLKGIKMRMANDKTGVEVWTHLGTEVRVLGWAETYDGISKGIVNAVTSPIALVESMRFQEVAPVITRTDEYWQSIAFMMNQKAFDRLPKDLQEALVKAHKDAARYSEELMGKETVDSLKRMKAKGVAYNEIDLKPFVKHMLVFYKAKEASGELPKGFMDVVEATRKKTS